MTFGELPIRQSIPGVVAKAMVEMILESMDYPKTYEEVGFGQFRGTHAAIEGLAEELDIQVGELEDYAIQAYEEKGVELPSGGSSSGMMPTQFGYVVAEPVEAPMSPSPPTKRGRISVQTPVPVKAEKFERSRSPPVFSKSAPSKPTKKTTPTAAPKKTQDTKRIQIRQGH